MNHIVRLVFGAFLGAVVCGFHGFIQPADAAPKLVNCAKFHIDVNAETALLSVVLPPPNGCTAPSRNGFPIPDSKCTPGAINPTLTADVLRDFLSCRS